MDGHLQAKFGQGADHWDTNIAHRRTGHFVDKLISSNDIKGGDLSKSADFAGYQRPRD